MMRKIVIAAIVLPLMGGAALARCSPHVGRNVDTSVGPEAWPSAAASLHHAGLASPEQVLRLRYDAPGTAAD